MQQCQLFERQSAGLNTFEISQIHSFSPPTMIIPLVASTGLISLSSIFVYASTEQLLRKKYGDQLYETSFYAQDLSIYAGFTACMLTLHFVGGIFMSSFTTNAAVLSVILLLGYYITFRGILLSVFTKRFSDILKSRYGITEQYALDGCAGRFHTGDVTSFVANHMAAQMKTSSKVAIPTGIVWVMFVFATILYLPTSWVYAFTISGEIALFFSMVTSIFMLPESDCDKAVSFVKSSPLGNLLPPGAFLGLFTILTPIVLEVQKALPLFM